MSTSIDRIEALKKFQDEAEIRIHTLGQFAVWRQDEKIESKAWSRDKTTQLLQFLVSNRHRNALHKERIMDQLWDDWNDNDFKVAMHGINKALEPNRASRTEPKYIIRQGLSYQLNLELVWIDAEAVEQYITIGNENYGSDDEVAKLAYKSAIELYNGMYLPNRIYEDWSSEEREKIQVLVLGAYITLAEILLDKNPMESVRLAQKALAIDATWEDAYRIQMQAYINKGNRPQAIKAYKKCKTILDKEYGIVPLPETKQLLQVIENIG